MHYVRSGAVKFGYFEHLRLFEVQVTEIQTDTNAYTHAYVFIML